MGLDEWKQISIEQSEAGVVARPAIFIYLAIASAEEGEFLWQSFRKQVPAAVPLFHLTDRSTSMKPLSTRSINQTLTALRKSDPFFWRVGDEENFRAGQYALEIRWPKAVYISVPVEWGEDRTEDVVNYFKSLADHLSLTHASVAYGFNMVYGREFEQAAQPVIMQVGMRYQAIDVQERETDRLGGLKSAAWLQFINHSLMEKLGDPKELTSQGVLVEKRQKGYFLRTSEKPTLGDVAHEKVNPALLATQTYLRPLRIQDWQPKGNWSGARFREYRWVWRVNGFQFDRLNALHPNDWFFRMEDRPRPAGVPANAYWMKADHEWVSGPLGPGERKEGLVKYYRPDGTLCCATEFKEGIPHGPFQRFHENGEVSREGRFDRGKLEGIVRYQRSTEKTTEYFIPYAHQSIWRGEIDFRHDAEIEQRFFDRAGQRLNKDGSPYVPMGK
jgi:hypothetical protein